MNLDSRAISAISSVQNGPQGERTEVELGKTWLLPPTANSIFVYEHSTNNDPNKLNSPQQSQQTQQTVGKK